MINQNEAKSQISLVVSTSRIWALISIVCAHLAFPGNIGYVFSKAGNIGVVVFLISAGYYFEVSKFQNFGALAKRKLVTIVIPWMILGSMSYMLGWVNAYLKAPQHFSLMAFLKYLLGNGSYLYYLTVLMILFAVFYFFHTKPVLYTAILINTISQLLTSFGLLDSMINTISITHYLNVCNWCGFFALGMCLRKVKCEKLVGFMKKTAVFFALAFLVIFGAVCFGKVENTGYFGYFGLPYELLGALAVFSVSYLLPLTKNKLALSLSKASFAIYLIHYNVFAVIDGVLLSSPILTVLAPVIVILLCYAVLMLLLRLAKIIKLEKLYKTVSGIRS